MGSTPKYRAHSALPCKWFLVNFSIPSFIGNIVDTVGAVKEKAARVLKDLTEYDF